MNVIGQFLAWVPAYGWITVGGLAALGGLCVWASMPRGQHASPRGGPVVADVTTATLPRVEVAHEPPWEPAPPVFHPAPPAGLGTWQPRDEGPTAVWGPPPVPCAVIPGLLDYPERGPLCEPDLGPRARAVLARYERIHAEKWAVA